jgi:uncharacterized protein with HEPN domain
MLDAILLIENYIAVGESGFLADVQRQDAVIRRLEIIGEAVKRLSPDVRTRYPEADWKGAAGLRDVLIHQYMNIDLPTVWKACQQLPDLRRWIEAILAEGLDENR